MQKHFIAHALVIGKALLARHAHARPGKYGWFTRLGGIHSSEAEPKIVGQAKSSSSSTGLAIGHLTTTP